MLPFTNRISQQRIYINPEQVCAIDSHEGQADVWLTSGEIVRLAESVDTVAKQIETAFRNRRGF